MINVYGRRHLKGRIHSPQGSSRQRTSQGGECIRPSCPPQQASDPLKGSTVCLCRETRPPQLSHRVAVRRKGTREIGVWGKVPPVLYFGFYRQILNKNRRISFFLFTLDIYYIFLT